MRLQILLPQFRPYAFQFCWHTRCQRRSSLTHDVSYVVAEFFPHFAASVAAAAIAAEGRSRAAFSEIATGQPANYDRRYDGAPSISPKRGGASPPNSGPRVDRVQNHQNRARSSSPALTTVHATQRGPPRVSTTFRERPLLTNQSRPYQLRWTTLVLTNPHC